MAFEHVSDDRRKFGSLSGLDRECDQTVAHLQGGFNRIRETPLDAFLHHQSVDDDFNGVLLVAVHLDVIGDFVHLAIDPNAYVSGFGNVLEFFLVLALSAPNNGSQDLHLGAFREHARDVDDLIGRLPFDGSVTVATVRSSNPSEENPEVVVCLRDRTNR